MDSISCVFYLVTGGCGVVVRPITLQGTRWFGIDVSTLGICIYKVPATRVSTYSH